MNALAIVLAIVSLGLMRRESVIPFSLPIIYLNEEQWGWVHSVALSLCVAGAITAALL